MTGNRLLAASVSAVLVCAGCSSRGVTPPPLPPVDSIGTYAGTGISGFRNGSRVDAWLYLPCDAAVDEATGTVYIVDWNNHRIRAVFPGTDTLCTVAGGTGVPSDTNLAVLNHPSSIALGAGGAIYIAAFHNHQVRASVTMETVPFWGDKRACVSDVGGAEARFDLPTSVAFGTDSTLYVSVSGCLRIDAILHDGVVPQDRSVVTFAGTGAPGFSGDGGPAIGATFDAPTNALEPTAFRLALSPDKRFLFVCDSYNHRVRRIALNDPQRTIITVAGSGPTGAGNGGYSGDGGLATTARLNFPTDVEVDVDGSFYICDQGNNAIRKVDAAGMIHTVAGDGRAGFSGDGASAVAARFNVPNGIGLDRVRKRLYVADQLNHRVRVITLAR